MLTEAWTQVEIETAQSPWNDYEIGAGSAIAGTESLIRSCDFIKKKSDHVGYTKNGISW